MKKILTVIFMLVELTITEGAKASTIVDSLGQATPNTQFSIFGSSGPGISSGQLVGPEFVLTQPTILTEIGGFVNNCSQIIGGQPFCPGTLPFTVQIRPSLNGVPDLFNTIGSFVLSNDDDPLTISYEFVAPNLSLEPGAYFALFASQGLDSGYLLHNTFNPDNPDYEAESVNLGFLVFDETPRSLVEQAKAAVRILGTSSTEPGLSCS